MVKIRSMQSNTLGALFLTQLLVQAFTLDINSPEFHAPLFGHKLQRDNPNKMGLGMALDNRMVPPDELTPKFWRNLAKDEIKKRLNNQLNRNKAKNVIFFLGDGMPLTTVTAARIYQGQRVGYTGEEQLLSFEKFPYTGLSRTYCTNGQVPDSACTSTAYMCGVKANMLTLGVNARVNYNNCTASMDSKNHVSSILSWAQAAGKSTGFITTTTLTHASPSGGYAHVANRLWESDADVRNYDEDPTTCLDIAQQLITKLPGKKLDVLMGGGMGKFLPNTIKDSFGNMGERLDGKNLLTRWQNKHPNGIITKNREQLLRFNITQVSNIMGLFESKLMKYNSIANADQPTLAEMTGVALAFLNQNKNGYFIFIEGGLIDYANHENKLGVALNEILEFDKAIQLARAMTDPAETLIVVSADHGHALSMAGYPERGNNILGLNELGADANGVPYATMNYAVGPQQYQNADGTRMNLKGKIGKQDFVAPSYIKSKLGIHGGDDVGVYASGPWEHLFRGVLQQNSLPLMMAYASCLGPGLKMCDKSEN